MTKVSEKEQTVILFTYNLPTGSVSEAPFLKTELDYLAKKFSRVLIVPEKHKEPHQVPLSPRYEVDMSLAETLEKRNSRLGMYLAAATSFVFWSEICSLRRKPSLDCIKAALWFFGEGYTVYRWFFDFIRKQNINLSNSVFYTYWLDKVAFGVALAKKWLPQMNFISRAHGIDLYESRKSPPFFPFREFTLTQLDRLYLISDDGFSHISKMFPAFASKYRVSKLGVRGPQDVAKHSPQGLRIVSCAYIRPVKRIDLLVQGIDFFATENPEIQIFWDHFGGGELLDKVIDSARKLPANVVCKFWGNVPNDLILNFYQNNPVDVFVSVSSSEGIPVSMMEAMANGIPIIATLVGGVSEIVNKENGVLLTPNPQPEEIANALKVFFPYSQLTAKKRQRSRSLWESSYDADRNYSRFSLELLNLVAIEQGRQAK